MHRTITAIAILACAASLTAQGFWESRTSLNTAREEVGAAALGDSIYVAGGLVSPFVALDSVERFDPVANTWMFAAPMPTTRHHFGMAAAGGYLWIIGGFVGPTFIPDDAVYRYDPATDSWTQKASLPQPRGALAAVAIDGLIYAVGGEVASGPTGELTRYDPATDTWSTLAPMPTPREHLAATTVSGKLYAIGGRQGFGSELAAFEFYDPVGDNWLSLPPMPTARGGISAAPLDGAVVVVGGEGPGGIHDECEQWHPFGGWTTNPPMPQGLHGIYAVRWRDEIVVPGGGTVPGLSESDVVLSFRRLPGGVERVGDSTNWPCAGSPPIRAHANARPFSPAPSFAFTIGFDGPPAAVGTPPSAVGALILSLAADPVGVVFMGTAFHVDLIGPTATLPANTDALGRVSVPFPIPAGLSLGSQLAAQFVWIPPAFCPAFGFVAASDALLVTSR